MRRVNSAGESASQRFQNFSLVNGAPGGIRIRGPGQPKPPAINGFPRSVNPKGRYAKPGYTTGAVSCRPNGFFTFCLGLGLLC